MAQLVYYLNGVLIPQGGGGTWGEVPVRISTPNKADLQVVDMQADPDVLRLTP